LAVVELIGVADVAALAAVVAVASDRDALSVANEIRRRAAAVDLLRIPVAGVAIDTGVLDGRSAAAAGRLATAVAAAARTASPWSKGAGGWIVGAPGEGGK
jgi:hypothetical protein